MDKNIAEKAVQIINSLEVLDKVNSFYHDAWGMLIIFVTILIALFVVVIPIITQNLQKRFFRIEEEKIKKDIKEDVRKDVERKFDEEKEKLGTAINKLERKLAIEISNSQAVSFHMQGSTNFRAGDYKDSIESLSIAISSYLKGNDERNLRRALNSLPSALNNVNKHVIKELEDEETSISNVMESLEYYDNNDRFKDCIVAIRKALSLAKDRNT